MLKTTNETRNGAQITGADCWVEGCRLHAPLTLHGRSVVVGVDVGEPFEMPEGACLDVTPGFNRQDEPVWFVRYYGVEDTFKHSLAGEATFCGRRFADWLTQVGADGTRVWDAGTPEGERTLWNARVFPAERVHGDYRQWRWMCDVERATPEQKRRFLDADRYSSAEIAVRVNQAGFHQRRAAILHRLAQSG